MGQNFFKYTNGKLKSATEIEVFGEHLEEVDGLEPIGYTWLDEVGRHKIWQRGDEFIVELDICPCYGRWVKIVGVPAYIEFIRDYVNPLLQWDKHRDIRVSYDDAIVNNDQNNGMGEIKLPSTMQRKRGGLVFKRKSETVFGLGVEIKDTSN